MAGKVDLLKYMKDKDSDKDIILSPEHAKALAAERQAKGLSELQAVAPSVMRQSPTVEAAVAAKPEVAPVASTGEQVGGEGTSAKPASFDLATEYKNLMGGYTALGSDQKKALQVSYDSLNNTIKELNSGFETQMSAAKSKAEKDKTRAEWASIASMLAKNIVGFAAAQAGVSPQAMAYETADWGKRIADINDSLKNDLSNMREVMKDKVNQAKGIAESAKDVEDVDFKTRMKQLDTKGEILREKLRQEAETERAGIKAKSSEELAQQKADQVTTKIEPPDLTGIFTKKEGEKDADVISKIKAAGVKYGVTPEAIQGIINQTDTGTLGFGKGNEVTPEGQDAIANLFMNKYKQTLTTRSGSGQAAQPVVQSEGMVTITDIASGKAKQYPANHPAVAKAKGNPKFKVE